jgi:hypothetical protein
MTNVHDGTGSKVQHGTKELDTEAIIGSLQSWS